MPPIYFVGVDVGTSSARAALVNSQGQVMQMHTREIETWNPMPDHYEQSSDNIWQSVCECVQKVVKNVDIEDVAGISFDATCSLVVLGENGEPLTVSTTGQPNQNIILWMDHRATKEADIINGSNHDLLRFVGGKVSLEMEIPKLLWLKNNLNISCWSKIWRAFDLPDFLTWKSTGCDTRSLCSVVCKWNYDALNECWSEDFLNQIGLKELCRNDFEIIGKKILVPGTSVGSGLTDEAASSLGLLPKTPVGASLIDAHAGILGMLGCNTSQDNDVMSKLALICGTSTCHMSITKEPCWARGVWGPYKSAVIPDYFLNEGGQSATGILLDFMISTHPVYPEIKEKLKSNENVYSYLTKLIEHLAEERNLSNTCFLTKSFHVWPDFHGNRSPLADPNLKGMICGLDMKKDEENLAILYLAVIQALSYGTRHIIESLYQNGRPPFKSILICGGVSKNKFYVQTHADVCNLPVIIPNEQEKVLVGAAMLGACAAKVYPSLEEASKAMGGSGTVINPNPDAVKYHERKYKVFLKMLDDQKSYSDIMG